MNISTLDKQLFWFLVVLPVLMIITGLSLFLMLSAQKANAGVFDGVFERVIAARLLYSPSCFAYEDSNGRVYTGLVDLTKINVPTFQRCVPITSNSETAVKITIEYEQDGGKKGYDLTTSNWKTKNMYLISTGSTYPINTFGAGPGSITFLYKK